MPAPWGHGTPSCAPGRIPRSMHEGASHGAKTRRELPHAAVSSWGDINRASFDGMDGMSLPRGGGGAFHRALSSARSFSSASCASVLNGDLGNIYVILGRIGVRVFALKLRLHSHRSLDQSISLRAASSIRGAHHRAKDGWAWDLLSAGSAKSNRGRQPSIRGGSDTDCRNGLSRRHGPSTVTLSPGSKSEMSRSTDTCSADATNARRSSGVRLLRSTTTITVPSRAKMLRLPASLYFDSDSGRFFGRRARRRFLLGGYTHGMSFLERGMAGKKSDARSEELAS